MVDGVHLNIYGTLIAYTIYSARRINFSARPYTYIPRNVWGVVICVSAAPNELCLIGNYKYMHILKLYIYIFANGTRHSRYIMYFLDNRHNREIRLYIFTYWR